MMTDRAVRVVLPANAAALRGVYLWAGNATIDLQRVKFPDLPVDQEAHLHAHSQDAAEVLADMGVNWAFLSMNWGFPPEREATHWAEFAEALCNYSNAGLTVLGYVQASNCLAEGSYAERDWYARTPAGRTIPYFRRRLMTCWNNLDWVQEVAAHARRVVAAGAAGVFFDNVWMGATPWTLGGTIGGFAGCWCARCRNAFSAATGLEIPRTLRSDKSSTHYLEWRAGVVRQRLRYWTETVRAQRSDALVLANNCDVVLRDTRALFGCALEHVGVHQDAVLIENIAMPRHDAARRRLVSNSLPVRVVRAVVPDRPILTVTYEHGIGLDGPPEPRCVRRAIAELVALGASPILKGSEYLDSHGRFTVVTSKEFAPLRAALAPQLRWIDVHAARISGARHDPAVHVLYDEVALSRAWARTASVTFAVAQALLAEGVPFGFVTRAGLEEGQGDERAVLVPPGLEPPIGIAPQGTRLLIVPEPLDVPAVGLNWLSHSLARSVVDPILTRFAAAYFGSASTRRLVDQVGLTARFLQSPYFTIPRNHGMLRELLPVSELPPVRADGAILVERWCAQDGRSLVHLVNYEDRLINVEWSGPGAAPVLLTPDTETRWMGAANRLQLECWAVLECAGSGNA